MVCCSKKFYAMIPSIKKTLEQAGHEVVLPNCYDNPGLEEQVKQLTPERHQEWKCEMFKQQKEKIIYSDAILILNLPQSNYSNRIAFIPGHIGGSTFLEAYEAWQSGIKIYLYTSNIPEIMKDEFSGFGAVCIDKDLSKII